MAQRQRARKLWLKEKPSSAAAVRQTLSAVTSPVPSFRVRRSLFKLETTVPAEMSMKMTPEADSGTPSSAWAIGQAEPSSESGRPSEMKAR